MFSVDVNREALLAKLIENRDNHKAVYDEAVVNYRKAAAEEAERQVSEILKGKIIRIAVNLPIPEDHTDDYDSIIGLLKLSEQETVILNAEDYASYYLDNWRWRAAWLSNTASYSLQH